MHPTPTTPVLPPRSSALTEAGGLSKSPTVRAAPALPGARKLAGEFVRQERAELVRLIQRAEREMWTVGRDLRSREYLERVIAGHRATLKELT